MAVDLKRRRFTVAEYRQMADVGLIQPDERVELLNGEIVEMSPIGSRHAAASMLLSRAFFETIGRRAWINMANPVETDEYGEPQPDLQLLRPRADAYASATPTAPDTLLVVEISDTSLGKDRRVKLPIYARANIPEVWIENLVDDVIEVHTDPTPEGYQTVRVARRGEMVSPGAFPDVILKVDDLLP
jgi:Uma2 family endonuclease